jgi:hypothetical protein
MRHEHYFTPEWCTARILLISRVRYWDKSEKLAFMDEHEINVSVMRCPPYLPTRPHILTVKVAFQVLLVGMRYSPLSSVNPWLDFSSGEEE